MVNTSCRLKRKVVLLFGASGPILVWPVAEIQLERITKVYSGDVTAVDDVSLTIGDGEFMVLVGPSGCGKSTLLRMIAGLEEVTEGQISIDGADVTELAPRRRDIAMVFQSYALYPHMSVRKNIGYGLKVRRTPKDEAKRRVEEVGKLLGLEELMERKPAQLSGGQRQRVAMGRAIVREPKAFLMDEPLSNLDAKLRVEMRASLAQLHARLGVTTVYVTHDQTEAMTLGQRVAVLDGGRILQVDTPQRLYEHPANLFVAAFIGTPAMNLVEGAIDGDEVVLGGFRVPLDSTRRPEGSPSSVVVGFRPEAFSTAAFAPPGATTFTGRPGGRGRAWFRRARLLPRRRRGGWDGRQRPRRSRAAAGVQGPLQRPRRPARRAPASASRSSSRSTRRACTSSTPRAARRCCR